MTTYADQMRAWAERRTAIYRHWTQSQNLGVTARAFGISRERARQIVIMEETKDGQDHARGSDSSKAAGTVLG